MAIRANLAVPRVSRAQLPDFISPQLVTLVSEAPAGDGWIHEIKLDGYRTAARLEAGKVRMLTRSGLDWTARFRPIAAALAVPKIRAAYLDGEIAVLGEDGVTSFAALQDALSRGQAQRLTYHVFDLLHLNGRDLAGLPKRGPVRYSDHVEGQGPKFFAQACKLHLEGIVSKLANSPYRLGRSDAWRKVKCLSRQEFVIGGWMESDKQGRSLRSLLLGYYDKGKLIFAGKAGTGFNLNTSHELVAQLRKLERADRPLLRSPAHTSVAPVGQGRDWWRRWPSRPGRLTTSCAILPSKVCGKTSPLGRSPSSGRAKRGADNG
jgi:bifunctional non-homologous end joining protein LigD